MKRALIVGVAALAFLMAGVATAQDADQNQMCTQRSVTQIAIQGKPMNPCQNFTNDPVTVNHTLYICDEIEQICYEKEITFILNTGGGAGKTQKQLAQELADHIEACMPFGWFGEIEVVDNVISIYDETGCGAGDPCTIDNPCVQPPGAKNSELHTSQRSWTY